MFSFPCPNCSVPLRIQDSHPRGRKFACPDCKTPLDLIDQNGKLVAIVSRSTIQPSRPVVGSPVSFRVLFAVIGSLVGFVLICNYWISTNGIVNAPGPDTPEPTVEVPSEPLVQGDPITLSPQPDRQTGELSTSERLQRIGSLVFEYQQQHGVFPNGKRLEVDGKPAEWSWIAEIMYSRQEQGLSLAVNRTWDDPVNDAFVRRRLELFQNLDIQPAIGDDRYPATHFAGISGVGLDAEKLPRSHPRAGIFSPYRECRISDIHDGTSHTMMLVGVSTRLGSWARPEEFALRSLTQEPYVNGPDGLGTGQPDSMLVLMADGSVRTLAAELSPIVARRMAAMADGLPLSLETPGDPLVMTQSIGENEKSVGSTDVGVAETVLDQPLEPLLAPEPPPFDIHKSLSARLKSYKLEKPTPVRVLIDEFAELAGVPVNVSLLSSETLNREVTLSVEDVSLEELLDNYAEVAEFDFEIQTLGILLKGR